MVWQWDGLAMGPTAVPAVPGSCSGPWWAGRCRSQSFISDRASMVAAPAFQLQAHSSSDWRASS